jgi:hypothetical protein
MEVAFAACGHLLYLFASDALRVSDIQVIFEYQIFRCTSSIRYSDELRVSDIQADLRVSDI